MGAGPSMAQLCGVVGRDELTLASSSKTSGPATLKDWIDEGRGSTGNGISGNSASSSFPAPLQVSVEKPDTIEQALSRCPTYVEGFNTAPDDILTAILGIERVCRGNIDHWLNAEVEEGQARVEVMVHEPGKRYCICHDPTTPIVTALFWIELAGITVDQAALALGDKKERQTWDGNAEFDILRPKQPDDTLGTEVTFHALRAPWPFSDRDVLQQRNRLPVLLDDQDLGKGVAFVTQSIDDESIYAKREDKVRAIAHMAGHVLRPLTAAKAQLGEKGIEVTVCQKLDIGGVAPAWAQGLLGRFAARSAQHWAGRLQQHCLAMKPGATISQQVDVINPAFELWDRELMGQ